MVKARFGAMALAAAAALVWVLTLIAPAQGAADYRFTVDRNISRVFVNRDASIDVEYWLTFTADRGARAIDIVDVGMPSNSYVF